MLVARGIGRNSDAQTGIVAYGLGESTQVAKRGGKLGVKSGYAVRSFIRRGLDMLEGKPVDVPKVSMPAAPHAMEGTGEARVAGIDAGYSEARNDAAINSAMAFILQFVAYLRIEDFVSMRIETMKQRIGDEISFLASEAQRLSELAIEREDEEFISILCVGV